MQCLYPNASSSCQVYPPECHNLSNTRITALLDASQSRSGGVNVLLRCTDKNDSNHCYGKSPKGPIYMGGEKTSCHPVIAPIMATDLSIPQIISPSFFRKLDNAEEKGFCLQVLHIIRAHVLGKHTLNPRHCGKLILSHMPCKEYDELLMQVFLEIAAQPIFINDQGAHLKLARVMKEMKKSNRRVKFANSTVRRVPSTTPNVSPSRSLTKVRYRGFNDLEFVGQSDTCPSPLPCLSLGVNSADEKCGRLEDVPNNLGQWRFISLCKFFGVLLVEGVIDQASTAIFLMAHTMETQSPSF
ncbi:hypothetical protein ACRALDRAFT_213647 [Sodiomyces alcalophilus JCM 7366]|uniref:uncharacterized protein n=1 Tax=Sodiomyces alcalophilus JCM 7366 TaxID=591952 RepID=UPI0039B6DC85